MQTYLQRENQEGQTARRGHDVHHSLCHGPLLVRSEVIPPRCVDRPSSIRLSNTACILGPCPSLDASTAPIAGIEETHASTTALRTSRMVVCRSRATVRQ